MEGTPAKEKSVPNNTTRLKLFILQVYKKDLNDGSVML